MRLLHAGCGTSTLPEFWAKHGPREVRLDIDPATKPDIVASLTDMGDIGTFDAVYCSHCVEHLYPIDVKTALAEFHRVTADDGYVMIIVPDLEGVHATDEPLYECEGVGWLSGLDLIYGCRYDAARSSYMAHHSGFVSSTLEKALLDAGFARVDMKRLPQYNLMAIARKAA